MKLDGKRKPEIPISPTVTAVGPKRFERSRHASSESSLARSPERVGTSARRAGHALASVLAAAMLVFTAPSAQAIERQHHLGLAPALGILSIKGKSTTSTGVGGALHYTYGLTDQWNLTIEGGSVVVAADQEQDSDTTPRNRPAAVDHGGVGVSYVIDILRWVPYIGVQGGVYRLAGGTLAEPLILPGLSLGGGLDYQFSRQVAVGVGARQHFMLSKLDTYPSYTTVLLRLEYMWGY